jgi:hypothetical protein
MFSFENFEEVLEWFLSDLATWDIDNTLETHTIERIEYDANIRKNVLDLSAFVELHSTENSIWDILADERFFEKTRLSVGAIENSEVWVGGRR